MTCTACDAELPAAARFCASCGPAVRTEAPPEGDPVLAALERGLAHQYRFVRLLGRGGMGAVYLARESALERAVAIKVLPPQPDADESRERFRREARTAAGLSHPNIVPLLTFGERGCSTT
jgi:serine/threonine protein kinase